MLRPGRAGGSISSEDALVDPDYAGLSARATLTGEVRVPVLGDRLRLDRPAPIRPARLQLPDRPSRRRRSGRLSAAASASTAAGRSSTSSDRERAGRARPAPASTQYRRVVAARVRRSRPGVRRQAARTAAGRDPAELEPYVNLCGLRCRLRPLRQTVSTSVALTVPRQRPSRSEPRVRRRRAERATTRSGSTVG